MDTTNDSNEQKEERFLYLKILIEKMILKIAKDTTKKIKELN